MDEIEVEIFKLQTKKWIEKVLYDSIYYRFIQKDETNEARKIMEKYSSEDEFFQNCHNSKDNFVLSLVNASQI